MWITFTKKCGALNILKYDRGIWGNLYIYVINLPLIHLKTLFWKLSCLRGPMPVWFTCRRSIITLMSHFVTFVTVSCLIRSVSVTGAERPGKCHAARSVLYTHHEYPGMAWKFDIWGFYVVIIPYFLRLNWVLEGCKTRVLGIYGHLAALSMSLSSKKN